MKITFVNYYYNKDLPIDEYFNKYLTIHGWSRELSDLGLEVSVYQRFNQNTLFERDGVKYFLMNDNKRHDLKWYQHPISFHNKICGDNHDIIHMNSFIYSYQASLLKKQLPSAKLVVQHHAEKPGHKIKRFLLRNFSSSADVFIFSSSETGPYPLGRIKIPVLVIDALDDPITNIENVRRLAERMPNARLFVVPDGGHFFFGHREEVKEEIVQFLYSIVAELKTASSIQR